MVTKGWKRYTIDELRARGKKVTSEEVSYYSKNETNIQQDRYTN